MKTVRQQQEADALQLRDALRGELQLLGAAPEATMVTWVDDRPRISLTLTPVLATHIMERLDPSTIHVRAIPTMVMWDGLNARIGQVLHVENEYASLDRVGPSRTWRAPLANLRPPLYSEVVDAVQKQRHA